MIVDLPGKLKDVRVTHVFELHELIRRDYCCELDRYPAVFGGDARLYARRESAYCVQRE